MEKIMSPAKLTASLTALALFLSLGALAVDSKLTDKTSTKAKKEQLGQILFFDTSLSANKTQSCATCHDPANGFVDKRKTIAQGIASLGDDGHSFGNRNTPTAGYASLSPKFHFDEKTKQYLGGQFWDGRASTLAEQAKGPPLNPVEMNMQSEQQIMQRLKANPFYEKEFEEVYGKNIWQNPKNWYEAMADAIQAFEQTDFFAPFDSKYDRFLRGEYELTVLEDLGRSLFFSSTNVNCSTCHMLKREDAEGEPFTNFEYHNIGTPSNPAMIKLNKLKADFVDHGLLENPAVSDVKQDGKFKTPTLRNIAVTAPYMHNGVFQDLRTVILFYDKYNNPERTINPETNQKWGEPEVAKTVNLKDLAAKKFTERKVDAMVAFLKTLTDKRYEHLLESKKKEEDKK